MNIDLNESEIKLIDTALEVWEKDAQTGALMTSMFTTMLASKEERRDHQKEIEKKMAEGAVESQNRRIKSVLLRAKLYQALSRQSEHTIE